MTDPTVEELAAVPLFTSFSRRELAAVAKLFVVRSYAKNTIVATEGEHYDHLNFILSGYVQAFWRDDAGHELRLGVDGPGDHFLDLTLNGERHLTYHIAIAELRVATISHADLYPMLRRHPEMAIQLMLDMVARLRRIVARTKALAMEDVYERVVKVLAGSSPLNPHRRPEHERLTHADIGYRIGATREMVGRVLRDLARGGYVKIERGHVTVLRKLPKRW